MCIRDRGAVARGWRRHGGPGPSGADDPPQPGRRSQPGAESSRVPAGYGPRGPLTRALEPGPNGSGGRNG
eukprot:14454536-Alexandrium_andersonii.AAC.1